MDEINRLVLNCMEKVLRINQTTSADLMFGFSGHVNALSCWGFRNGYKNSPQDEEGNPIRDFEPIDALLVLDYEDAIANLYALLESLNTLEKELILNERIN